MLIAFLFLSGCTLPNLYDVQLPDMQNETSENVSAAEFTSANIKVKIKNEEIICTNTFVSKEKIMFAWYIVQADNSTPVYKSDYIKSNSFTYSPKVSGTYQIIAYIRYPDSTRTSVKAQIFSYNSEYKQIIIFENATDISAFTSESVEIEVTDNRIRLENKLPISDLSYAWYVIDTDSNRPIIKENYSNNNVYEYEVLKQGNYKIEAFIKTKTGDRKSAIIIEFSYDGSKLYIVEKEKL